MTKNPTGTCAACGGAMFRSRTSLPPGQATHRACRHSYSAGCRCADCRAKHAARCREYAARRRGAELEAVA